MHCVPDLDRHCSYAETTWQNATRATAMFDEKCTTERCWDRFYTYFDRSARIFDKNPHAMLWPHVAKAYAAEAKRCGTKLLVVLRSPLQRSHSHFTWTRTHGLPGIGNFPEFFNKLREVFSQDIHRLRVAKSDAELISTWTEVIHAACAEDRVKVMRNYMKKLFNLNPAKRDRHICAVMRVLLGSLYAPQLLMWLTALREAGVDESNVAVMDFDCVVNDCAVDEVGKLLGISPSPKPKKTRDHTRTSTERKDITNENFIREFEEFYAPFNKRLRSILDQSGVLRFGSFNY
jgi:hypothetical protein